MDRQTGRQTDVLTDKQAATESERQKERKLNTYTQTQTQGK